MFAMSRKASLAMLKDLFLIPKTVIQVTLTDDQKDEKMPKYTSLDEIKGEVSITASCDTSFDDIYIAFEGNMHTFVEKEVTPSPTTSRSKGFLKFIRLVQPLDPSSLPTPRVFEAGQTYKFPFTFVVPHALLPQSCTHPKKPGFPEDGHMILPPSLGDPMVKLRKSLIEDMSPEMATIGTFDWKKNLFIRGLDQHDLELLKAFGFQLSFLFSVSSLAPVSLRGSLPIGMVPSTLDCLIDWLLSQLCGPYCFWSSHLRLEVGMLTPVS